MGSALDRLAAFFVAAPVAAAEPRAAARPRASRAPVRAAVAPSIAVLGGPEAAPFATLLAAAVARARRMPAALVCRWPDPPAPLLSWSLPPAAAARRLATSLTQRGHTAHAAGRAAIVDLAGDPQTVIAESARAAAAAAGAPVVLALAGPRAPELDAALTGQDLLVVTHCAADPPAAGLAADLARADLAAAHPEITVRSIAVPRRPTLLPGAPLAPAPLRAALAELVGALP